MKLLVASDIHGSAYYAEKLIERFVEEKADKLLLLGDIMYHGPRNALPKDYNPMKVAQLLNEYKSRILCVQGNCDADIDTCVLEFPMSANYLIIYDGSRTIFATHGHIYNKETLPPLNAGDIFMQGHNHTPEIIDMGEITYANPGSTSIPKSDFGSSYMIYEDGRMTLYKLEDSDCVSK